MFEIKKFLSRKFPSAYLNYLESKKMVDAVNQKGGNAKQTIFEKDGHNSWDSAFATSEMWEWLFKQKIT